MVRKNNKKQLTSSVDSIRKSIEFSMAKLNQGLTLNQMQLLAYTIYATQQNGGATQFTKSEFEKKFNIEYKADRAKEDVQRLLRLQASIEDLANDYFEYWNVFQSIKYDKGAFRFKWTDDMIPHILELKDKYVLTDLSITANFKSGFSWTLYDYLKSNYGFWFTTLSKEALMKLFSVEDKKTYINNTGRFKASVLDVAVEEINKYTELNVKYEEIKSGRSISGFKIIWSSGTNVTKASSKQMDILDLIVNTIFDDMFTFINLKNDVNRAEAIRMIQETEAIKPVLKRPISITANYCKELTDKANRYLLRLNDFLVEDGRSTIQGTKDLPLYNWLEE
jgi:plasmid replication initiation protein